MAYTGITGTVQGASPNFDPGVVCGANLDLSGVLPAGQVGNCFSADGELWIGSTSLSPGGTHARIGVITSSDASINVNNGPGTIDLTTTGGGGSNFSPNAVLQEFDDFLGFSGNGPSPKLAWNNGASGNPDPDTGTINNPGIVTFSTSGGANSALFIFDELPSGTSLGCVVPGSGTLTVSWVVKLNTLSGAGNTYRYSVGLADYGTLANFTDTYTNGIYFHYTDTVNSGNWQIKCTSASVTTTVNTSVAANTSFNTFTLVANAAGTSVSFYINNVLVGSAITTTIPTVALTPFMNAVRTAGTIPALSVDLFWISLQLTNARPGPSPTNGLSGIVVLNYRATAVSTLVTSSDMIIGVTDTSAPRTITMPASPGIIGQEWQIKDESAGASVNSITVDGNGNNIVGGTSAATYDITTNGGSISLYWNGTTFQIV
jgi:hypothetical protein